MSGVEEIRALDSSGQLDDVLALPDHLRDALWRVESAGLEPAESQRPDRLRDGRLGDRRPARPRRDGRRAQPADADLPRLRAAAVDGARPRRALLELLRRHRGDAGLLRGRRGARSRSLRGDHRRRARRRRAPGGGAGVSGSPAACSRATRSATASPSPARSRRSSAPRRRCGPRSTPRPRIWSRHARGLSPAPAEIAEQLAGTVPLIYGCDLTVPVAYRWKCELNENAKQHAFTTSSPSSTTTRSSAGRRTASDAVLGRSSSPTATSTRASASAPS